VFHISTSVLGVVTTVCGEEHKRFNRGEGLKGLDTSVSLDGQQIELVVRTGSAIAAAGSTAESLLEQATVALDQARFRGHRHVTYDAEHAADPQVQLALMSDIGRGLARGEFTLLYQAKASTHCGAIVGAEALMRWRHPVHGVISPDQFVTAAEETGAIDALTRWSLRQAIADQAVLRSLGVERTISINLSGRSLSSSEFCDFVIAETQKGAANLCLEITETGIIGDPVAAMASISTYRAAGIKISIDDYGSGLSSLAYLKQLMADELKLDKSLIRDIKTNSRDRLILKSTIDLAHGLGMSVVAEGIEDEASCALLTAMGCDCIQGYLVSRPVSLAEFASVCRARESADTASMRVEG
jgi:EAL domain-containing protein (putative c-di-GMP-specific phosphodiesterase class I)